MVSKKQLASILHDVALAIRYNNSEIVEDLADVLDQEDKEEDLVWLNEILERNGRQPLTLDEMK